MNESRVSPVNPPTASSWSAEEDADRLMDDVFSDIDNLLDGKKTNAKIQTAEQGDYTSLHSLVVPQIDLEGAPLGEEENKEVIIKRGWGYYSERLLFMGSCASLVGVVLWMAVNDKLRVPQFLVQSTPVVEVATETSAATANEPIFADYVRRALDNIDRQRSPQAAPINANGQPSQGNIPATSDQQQSASSPQVIERIYVPVYPPEVSANAREPLPQTTAPITPTPQIVTSQEAAPEVAPPQAAPPTLQDIQAVVPTLPAQPAAAKELYTLVGVLESGDRSAALFNINGVTQRFKVGENIGASNWKLLSVQNQQILMGQGGQTQTLFVGQNFGLDRE